MGKDLVAIHSLARGLLLTNDEEYLLPYYHVIVSESVRNGVEFTATNNHWCVVPRWIVEATEDFCSMGGYADMSLGEYLGKLVEEHNNE